MIKVLVNGASGRMGSEVVRSIEKEEGLILCGAVDPKCTGQDIGDVVGIGYKRIQIYGSLEEAFVSGKPDVVVDFTSPKVIYSNAHKYGYWHNWLENGRKKKFVCCLR